MTFSRQYFVAAATLVAAVLARPALANPTPTFPSLGSAGNYAVLGLNGTTIDINNINDSLVTINGNEGISQNGTITNMAPSVINGFVYESLSGEYSGPGTLSTGSPIVDPTRLTQNNTDVQNALSLINTDIPLVAFAGISGATTINGNGSVTVIDVTGNINLNNANLTVNGTSSDTFIFVVSGGLSLTGTAMLQTSGGVSAGHVIYDFTGNDTQTIQTHIGDTVDGVIISQYEPMTLDGTFNGELIGGDDIALLSGVTINGLPSPVPEPTQTGFVVLSLMVAIALAARKKLVRS